MSTYLVYDLAHTRPIGRVEAEDYASAERMAFRLHGNKVMVIDAAADVVRKATGKVSGHWGT